MTDLRGLPAVDRLASDIVAAHPGLTQTEAIATARDVLSARRRELLAGDDAAADLVERAAELLRPSLRPVVNATGVLIHTNLGRAPLATAAVDALAQAARGSTNLELDLDTGRRVGATHTPGGCYAS